MADGPEETTHYGRIHATYCDFTINEVRVGLTLLFEWGSDFAIARLVEEILVGWNIFVGHKWPFILLIYLLSNIIVGTVMQPGKKRRQKGILFFIHNRDITRILHSSFLFVSSNLSAAQCFFKIIRLLAR